jgi:hypothetical protein
MQGRRHPSSTAYVVGLRIVCYETPYQALIAPLLSVAERVGR